MKRVVNGFTLEVTRGRELPLVRVSLRDGTVVVNTDQLSVTGLQRLPVVLEVAASEVLQLIENNLEWYLGKSTDLQRGK